MPANFRHAITGLLLTVSLLDAATQIPVRYSLDMNSPEVRALPLPTGATWETNEADGSTSFQITTLPQANTDSLTAVAIPIDLRPYRNEVLLLTSRISAENVSQPVQRYNGIKCMIAFETPATGKHWLNQGSLYGTFEDREVNVLVPVPADATNATLYLGMQGCHGTARIEKVTLKAWQSLPERPPLAEVAAPPYQGHNLPRLRGVMSPQKFSEEDFVELEKWNVNLVRWQITRNWGQSNQNLDLTDYDRWMEQELNDLDRAADAAYRHGIMLVIDIHSPPGGRLPNNTIRMFLEKPYQDHFIELWEKIALRYRWHPAIWAYDLINEPVQLQPSPEGVNNWLDTQIAAARAIRAIDPDTAISITVDSWSSPNNFKWLAPVDIPNVIYQVHMYQPHEYTHQGVNNNWGAQSKTRELIAYPGEINGEPFDAETLRQALEPVRQFQLDANAHIYVGEFSAVRWAPGASEYLQDLIDIFEEYGWDWTYHAFREWPGWSVEHAASPVDPDVHILAPKPTDRAMVLLQYFALNEHPPHPQVGPEAENNSAHQTDPGQSPSTGKRSQATADQSTLPRESEEKEDTDA